MSHEINGNVNAPEWPSLDGDSIFMDDNSYLTPCWRHWMNRQKVSGVKSVTWDELSGLWTAAFGATEAPAPKSTSVAEIEQLLHKSSRRATSDSALSWRTKDA
jgi:hypothetical protein